VSPIEIESLIVRYVDGSASPEDMQVLRGFVASSPKSKELFRARVRLRRAQRGMASREAAEAVIRENDLPGLTEFDQLSYAYLDGVATRSQVIRLRDAIRVSADLRSRFQSRMRLHRAQTAYLRSRQQAGVAQALRSLSAFAQRFGRATVPAEYSGLMFYVESAVGSGDEPDYPLSVSPDEPDLPLTSDAFDLSAPPMPSPLPEAGLDELLESGQGEA
jgi:hypothetical protein